MVSSADNLSWRKIELGEDYSFSIGCTIFPHGDTDFLVFNKNVDTENSYRVDKIQLSPFKLVNLYKESKGPVYRSSQIVLSMFDRMAYIIGGIYLINSIEVPIDDEWGFDLINFQWIPLNFKYSDKPGKLGGHSLVSYKEFLYLFGGKSSNTLLNSLYEYNLKTKEVNRIESITSPPNPRHSHSSIIHKDSMIIYGEWDGTKTLNDMYEFSLRTKIWYQISYKSKLVAPMTYRHSNIIVDSFMFIFGGVNTSRTKYNSLYAFDFESRNWEILLAEGKIPSPRTFHNFIYRGQFIYVIGGFSNIRLNDVYELKVDQTQLLWLRDKFNSGVVRDKKKRDASLCVESVDLRKMDNEKLIEFASDKQSQVYELRDRLEEEISKNYCKV